MISTHFSAFFIFNAESPYKEAIGLFVQVLGASSPSAKLEFLVKAARSIGRAVDEYYAHKVQIIFSLRISAEPTLFLQLLFFS